MAMAQAGLLTVIALIAMLGAALAKDNQFAIHMGLIALIALALAIYRLRTMDVSGKATPPQADDDGYMDGPVRYGVIATLFWGLAGFLVGVLIAWQLAFPDLNVEPYLNFSRLRPLHTSAVIFAFGGNALICTSFYIVQRTTGARLALGNAAWFVFWGYQLFIVLAATGYLLGITQSKEYAEPEWYVDLWLTIVWVVYLVVFLGTLMKRKEPHIYVANWFFLAFIVTVAMLHIVNNAARAAHLRRQLVPAELHRHRGAAACGEQSGDPRLFSRLQELSGLCRRAGRLGAMVVRP